MPISMTSQQALAGLSLAQARLTGVSLSGKIQQLRQQRSPDKLQQMQSEVIVELYDAVKQIQDAIWPLMSTLPDVGAVRDAAAAAGTVPALTLKSGVTPKLTR